MHSSRVYAASAFVTLGNNFSPNVKFVLSFRDVFQWQCSFLYWLAFPFSRICQACLSSGYYQPWDVREGLSESWVVSHNPEQAPPFPAKAGWPSCTPHPTAFPVPLGVCGSRVLNCGHSVVLVCLSLPMWFSRICPFAFSYHYLPLQKSESFSLARVVWIFIISSRGPTILSTSESVPINANFKSHL